MSTLKVYPELYHEVFNEPERAVVLDDVTLVDRDHDCEKSCPPTVFVAVATLMLVAGCSSGEQGRPTSRAGSTRRSASPTPPV